MIGANVVVYKVLQRGRPFERCRATDPRSIARHGMRVGGRRLAPSKRLQRALERWVRAQYGAAARFVILDAPEYATDGLAAMTRPVPGRDVMHVAPADGA